MVDTHLAKTCFKKDLRMEEEKGKKDGDIHADKSII